MHLRALAAFALTTITVAVLSGSALAAGTDLGRLFGPPAAVAWDIPQATPAVSRLLAAPPSSSTAGAFLVSDGTMLTHVHADTGKTKWRRPLPVGCGVIDIAVVSTIQTDAPGSGDLVGVSLCREELIAYRFDSGAQAWSLPADSVIGSTGNGTFTGKIALSGGAVDRFGVTALLKNGAGFAARVLNGGTGHTIAGSGAIAGTGVRFAGFGRGDAATAKAFLLTTESTVWFADSDASNAPWTKGAAHTPAPGAGPAFSAHSVMVPAEGGVVDVYERSSGERYIGFAPATGDPTNLPTTFVDGPAGVGCLDSGVCGPVYVSVADTTVYSWLWLGAKNGARSFKAVSISSYVAASAAAPLASALVAADSDDVAGEPAKDKLAVVCIDWRGHAVAVDFSVGRVNRFGKFAGIADTLGNAPASADAGPQIVLGAPGYVLFPSLVSGASGVAAYYSVAVAFNPTTLQVTSVLPFDGRVTTHAISPNGNAAVFAAGTAQGYIAAAGTLDTVPTTKHLPVLPGSMSRASIADGMIAVVSVAPDGRAQVGLFSNETAICAWNASVASGDSGRVAVAGVPGIAPQHVYVTTRRPNSPSRAFWSIRRSDGTASRVLEVADTNITDVSDLTLGPMPSTQDTSSNSGPAVETGAFFSVGLGSDRAFRLHNGNVTQSRAGVALTTQPEVGDQNIYSADPQHRLVAFERGANFANGLRWTTALPEAQSAPAALHSFVYSAFGPHVYCTNKVTGLAVWVVTDHSCNFSNVAVAGKLVVATCLAANSSSSVTAQVYGILSGFWSFTASGSTVEWKTQLPAGTPPLGRPAYGNESDLLVFPHAQGLVGITRSNGTLQWHVKHTDVAGCTKLAFNRFFNVDALCPSRGFVMISPQDGSIWRRLPAATAADDFVRANDVTVWVHVPRWAVWSKVTVTAEPPGLQAAKAAAAAVNNWCHASANDADKAPCAVKQISYHCFETLTAPDKNLACPTKFNFPCPKYHYCPVTSSFEQKAFECPSGGYCPGNTSCVMPCPKGYYCARLEDPKICPAGSVCPSGSGEPKECGYLDFCVNEPGQVETRAQYLALSAIGAVAVCITMFMTIRKVCCTQSVKTHPMVQHGRRHAERWAPTAEEQQRLMFKCADVHHSAWNGARILRGVKCNIERNKFTVLMGPSGSGKTSLLNVLSGRAWSQGRVSRNSIWRNVNVGDGAFVMKPLTPALVKELKAQTGFVPQDDIMHRQCTVGEVLRFQALCRTDVGKLSVDNAVLEVLGKLGVAPEKLDVLVGDEVRKGISGGQRKRVSVAMELLPSPAVLFLDEPTSGLDSKSSLDLCHILKNLSRHLTVVAVMHQPSKEMIDTMDNIILMHRGRVSYSGPACSITNWTARVKKATEDPRTGHAIQPIPTLEAPRRLHNPIDAYMDQLTDDADPGAEERANTRLRAVVRYGMLLRNNVKRSLMIMYWHDLDQFVIELILWLVGCALVSYALPKATFNDFQTQSAMGSGLLLTLFAQYSCIKIFAPHYERAIADREFRAGLKPFPYFVGKAVAVIPKVLLLPAIFMLQYAVIDPPVSPLDFFLVLLGESFASFAYGLLLSAILDEQLALTFAVLSGFVFLVLSGFNPCLTTLWDALPVELIMKIVTGASPVRWTFDALSSRGYDNISEFGRLCAVPKIWGCGFVPTDPFWAKVGMLPGLGVVYLLATIIALQWRRWRNEAGFKLSNIPRAIFRCCETVHDDEVPPDAEEDQAQPLLYTGNAV